MRSTIGAIVLAVGAVHAALTVVPFQTETRIVLAVGAVVYTLIGIDLRRQT